MHLMLLAAGVLAVAAGVIGLLFGAANFSPGVGNTLILVGTVAVVGGALLVGQGAVLSRLRRIHDTLESQMVPRANVPSSETGAPGAASPLAAILRAEPAAGAASPLAAESGTSPGGAEWNDPRSEPRARSAEPVPVASGPLPGGALSSAGAGLAPGTPEPRAEWPRVEAPRPSETIVVRADGSITTEIEPRHEGAPAVEAPAPREGGSAAFAFDASGSPAILKSGVVEGMAYTLYDDGSIEAEMPDGTIRFNSIAELRAHLRERAQSAG